MTIDQVEHMGGRWVGYTHQETNEHGLAYVSMKRNHGVLPYKFLTTCSKNANTKFHPEENDSWSNQGPLAQSTKTRHFCWSSLTYVASPLAKG